MSKSLKYRPYYHDYCVHCIRHYLSREINPDIVPIEELTECSRQDLAAVEQAMEEMTYRQKYILNECYSPVASIQMFNIQFAGACEKLGIDENRNKEVESDDILQNEKEEK